MMREYQEEKHYEQTEHGWFKIKDTSYYRTPYCYYWFTRRDKFTHRHWNPPVRISSTTEAGAKKKHLNESEAESQNSKSTNIANEKQE